MCPTCGNLRIVCEDPETDWYPQRTRCWASATQQMVDRKFHKKHQDAQPDRAGFLPTDGTFIWTSTEDLTPDDHFI